MFIPMPPKSKLWLLIIMRWQVYRLARLVGKVVQLQHRGTHWWAAPLYQKQRNRSGLNKWLGCLASWYTSNFNCLQKTGFHPFDKQCPLIWSFKWNAITRLFESSNDAQAHAFPPPSPKYLTSAPRVHFPPKGGKNVKHFMWQRVGRPNIQKALSRR